MNQLSKEYLEEQYLVNKRSQQSIATEFGLTLYFVQCQMSKFGIKTRYTPKLSLNYAGKSFGVITVIDRDKDCPRKWICKCSCGNILSLIPGNFLKERKHCKKCRNNFTARRRWKGHGEISGSHWQQIANGAKVRDFEFSITIEYIWELFLKQDRKCILSGLELKFVHEYDRRSDTTASLDRIDSSKGYIPGNVQWIHKDINRMKWCHDEPLFIKYCYDISQNLGLALSKNDTLETANYIKFLESEVYRLRLALVRK